MVTRRTVLIAAAVVVALLALVAAFVVPSSATDARNRDNAVQVQRSAGLVPGSVPGPSWMAPDPNAGVVTPGAPRVLPSFTPAPVTPPEVGP